MSARIAVVTVSYDSATVLEPFLASLPGSAAEPVEVYVADNKTSSPQRDRVEHLTAAAGAHYLPMTGNLGYGDAMNTVVRELPSSVEFVLVTNPDVVLGEASIDRLVSAVAGGDDIGAAGPLIRELDGSVYPSARSVPSLRNGIGHALFANIWPANPWSRSYRNDSQGTPVRREAGWLSGACLLVRRSAFDGIGGFDTGYFMYFEDVDLGYRLGKAGWRNVYEPAAEVLHTGAHSTSGESARMLEAHHTSAKRFLTRKYPGPLLLPVRAVLSVGLDVRSFVVRRRASH